MHFHVLGSCTQQEQWATLVCTTSTMYDRIINQQLVPANSVLWSKTLKDLNLAPSHTAKTKDKTLQSNQTVFSKIIKHLAYNLKTRMNYKLPSAFLILKQRNERHSPHNRLELQLMQLLSPPLVSTARLVLLNPSPIHTIAKTKANQTSSNFSILILYFRFSQKIERKKKYQSQCIDEKCALEIRFDGFRKLQKMKSGRRQRRRRIEVSEVGGRAKARVGE